MKVLITGGLGFIGASLLTLLSKNENIEIHVMNHLVSSASKDQFVKWRPRLGDRLHIIDLKEADKISMLIKKQQFDVIVHLAAKAGVRESSLHPQLYTESNVIGTLNILQAIRLYSPHTRCILASSSTVHADPICSYYGLTKKMMEEMAELFCRSFNINIACLRFFSVYGSDCRQDLLIGSIIKCIRENKSLTVFGDGNIRRDFTYIDDTLEAIYRTIKKQWTGYLVADIGTGENHSVREVIEIVNTSPHLSKPLHILHREGRHEDASTSRACTDQAFKELRFRPQTSLTKGLEKILMMLED